MVVGLFGNLVTVIIMTRRRMRSTTNMYLAALAFVDMLYLVLTFLLGLSHYPNMAGKRYYLYWQLRPFLMMLTDACSNTSVWLTVTFTIERFIAVKYPMKGKVWCTEARAKRLIVCVFLFGILFASPVPFEWKVIEKPVGFGSLRQLTQAGDSREKNGSVSLERKAALEAFQDPFSVAAPHSGAKSTSSKLSHDDGIDDGAFDVDIGAGPGGPKVPMMKQEQRRPAEMIQKNYKDEQQEQAKSLVAQGETHDSPYILSLDYTDFGRNETYKTIYYWSTAVIFYFIPLLLLTFFNGFLILSVHRSLRERNRMTIGQQLTLSSVSKQGRQQTHSARTKKWRRQEAGSKPTPMSNSLDLVGVSYRQQANVHDTNSVKSKTRSMVNGGGQLVVAEQSGPHVNSVVAAKRLLTPKVSITSKQNCIIENDDEDGAEVADVKAEIGNSMETEKVFHEESLLGSGAERDSIDGGSELPNEDRALTRHISGDEDSIRGHPVRKVEFNCDKVIRDGGDLNDGTSMVQTNCDKMKSSTGGVGLQLVARGSNANSTSMSPTMNERDDLKNASMVPILKSQQNDAAAAEAPLPPPSASMTNLMCKTNQSSGGSSSSSLSMRSSSGLDQLARLDVSRDNALATTCNSSREIQQKKRSPQTTFECRLRHLASRTVANSGTISNNGHRKKAHTATTTNTSNNGKLNQIKSTLGSSPNINHTGSYHDSGSCTMIQPGTSMVPVSSQERRITIMLIAVVILFICCQIPSAAMLLYTSVREPIPNTNEHALVLAFGNIFNFLMAINAAGNFILYSFLSRKYRRTFVILFCSCLKKASEISNNNYSGSSKTRRQSSRASYFTSSQLLSHPSTSSSGLGADDAPRVNSGTVSGPVAERFTNDRSLKTKLSQTTKQLATSPPSNNLDNVNYLVDSGESCALQCKRRDTLV